MNETAQFKFHLRSAGDETIFVAAGVNIGLAIAALTTGHIFLAMADVAFSIFFILVARMSLHEDKRFQVDHPDGYQSPKPDIQPIAVTIEIKETAECPN